MKKETVKTFVIVILVILVVFLSVKSMKYYQKSQTKQPETKTITVTETLTNIVYDTVYLERYNTVKLPVVDTLILINDSLRIDSVFVEIPISIYKFDSCFTTDSTNLNIRIQNSGYNVKLDSLSYSFTYRPTYQKSNFFKDHIKFGAGVSTGFGVFSKKPDVFISVGVFYCF